MTEAQLRERFEFVTGIRFEMAYSLDVLQRPAARSHAAWRDAAQARLPDSLRDDLAWFGDSSFFWILVGDALGPDWPGDDIDALLKNLHDLDLIRFLRELLVGALHDGETADRVLSRSTDLAQAIHDLPPKKREWLEHIELYPPGADRPTFQALSRCVEFPQEAKSRIERVYRSYYEDVFKDTWRRVQPELARSLERKRRLFESTTLTEFFERSLIRVEADTDAGALLALRGGYVLPYTRIRKVYVVPSVFNQNRYWTTFESPDGAVSFIPYFDHEIPLTSEGGPVRSAEIDPALIFKALGDPTRFAIASLIAKSPMSSAQLAKMLDVSRPTISHHVLLLREAELLSEQSRGASVILSLRRETLEQLSAATLQRLFD